MKINIQKIAILITALTLLGSNTKLFASTTQHTNEYIRNKRVNMFDKNHSESKSSSSSINNTYQLTKLNKQPKGRVVHLNEIPNDSRQSNTPHQRLNQATIEYLQKKVIDAEAEAKKITEKFLRNTKNTEKEDLKFKKSLEDEQLEFKNKLELENEQLEPQRKFKNKIATNIEGKAKFDEILSEMKRKFDDEIKKISQKFQQEDKKRKDKYINLLKQYDLEQKKLTQELKDVITKCNNDMSREDKEDPEKKKKDAIIRLVFYIAITSCICMLGFIIISKIKDINLQKYLDSLKNKWRNFLEKSTTNANQEQKELENSQRVENAII